MGYTKYRTIRNQQKTLKLELVIRLKLERFGVCLIVLCRGWVCGGGGGGVGSMTELGSVIFSVFT